MKKKTTKIQTTTELTEAKQQLAEVTKAWQEMVLIKIKLEKQLAEAGKDKETICSLIDHAQVHLDMWFKAKTPHPKDVEWANDKLHEALKLRTAIDEVRKQGKGS